MKTTITFDEFGGINIDHVGFQGTACLERTEQLTKGLMATKSSDIKKPEIHRATTGSVGARSGRG
jgi:hypothetical protein